MGPLLSGPSLSGVPWFELFIFIISIVFVFIVFNYAVLHDSREEPVSFKVTVPEQCTAQWKGDELERPSLKVSQSSSIQCYCPATGRSLGLVNPTSVDGIDRAIAKAKDAQIQWATTTFAERRKFLKTLLEYVLQNQDTIARAACLDSGKTMIDAALGEILVTVEKLKWTIKHGERALRPESRPRNFLMMYKNNEVRWEPIGVVAACVSWNYPFHNFISPIISTLFSGSALVIKTSENTAWSTQYYSAIVRAALLSCGHSADLVQQIVCWPQTANHLTSHPSIGYVAFIGSRPVAHQIASSAAKSLSPLCLELGGKDPAIILDDVKRLEKVASTLMRGTFQSAGQNCVGIERIICLPRVYDRLIPILASRVRTLRIGSALDSQSPVDMGAMISDTNFTRLEGLISEAVAQGARLLAGGKRYKHDEFPKGHYFSPTLLVDVTSTMRISQEEHFAPICTVMKAASVDDAINLANSSPYGLGASVFGYSRRDLEKVTSEIKAGMVSVNDFAVYYAVSLPFGGVKGSGYGRFGGEEGLRSLCNTKAVCRDRWPGLLSTSIPPRLDYPLRDVGKAWQFAKGIIELGYAQGWARVAGLIKIVSNS